MKKLISIFAVILLFSAIVIASSNISEKPIAMESSLITYVDLDPCQERERAEQAKRCCSSEKAAKEACKTKDKKKCGEAKAAAKKSGEAKATTSCCTRASATPDEERRRRTE